jgi:hypothetical protein
MARIEPDYTPTTEEVKDAYGLGGDGADFKAEYWARREAFDRWLAAHDAEKDAEIARLSQRPTVEEVARSVGWQHPRVPHDELRSIVSAVLALFPTPKETPRG